MWRASSTKWACGALERGMRRAEGREQRAEDQQSLTPSPGGEGRGEGETGRLTLQCYTADLHIHTLLSPCAEIEMIPSLIIAAARMAGLDMIGIADHNSCENTGAVMQASEGSGVKVFPGMEVQSVEGVHLLCLFDELDAALEMQEAVYGSLPNVPGAAKMYEQQMVVDGSDEFVKYCELPISLPTSMDIDEIWERVTDLKGMVVPSHIDRLETGLCGVLGLMPESPEFEAFEISPNISEEQARSRYLSESNRAIFHDSDAHWLSAIGKQQTVFCLKHRTLAEIRMACRGEGGRRIENA